jgi:hypothetical protein
VICDPTEQVHSSWFAIGAIQTDKLKLKKTIKMVFVLNELINFEENRL